MPEADPPAVALRGAGDDLIARIRELAADGVSGYGDDPPGDVADKAWWYGTNPALIALSRHYDVDVTMHVVANCVEDMLDAGEPGIALAVLERLFVEAHAAGDELAIGRATWCGWLIAALKPTVSPAP